MLIKLNFGKKIDVKKLDNELFVSLSDYIIFHNNCSYFTKQYAEQIGEYRLEYKKENYIKKSYYIPLRCLKDFNCFLSKYEFSHSKIADMIEEQFNFVYYKDTCKININKFSNVICYLLDNEKYIGINSFCKKYNINYETLVKSIEDLKSYNNIFLVKLSDLRQLKSNSYIQLCLDNFENENNDYIHIFSNINTNFNSIIKFIEKNCSNYELIEQIEGNKIICIYKIGKKQIKITKERI